MPPNTSPAITNCSIERVPPLLAGPALGPTFLTSTSIQIVASPPGWRTGGNLVVEQGFVYSGRTASRAAAGPAARTSALGAHLVLDRAHDGRRVLPVGDARVLLGHGEPVLVHPGPVRVVELVQREARVQRVVEAHVVDALVDRLLDEQRGHGGQLRNAPGQLDRAVGQLVTGEDLHDHAVPGAPHRRRTGCLPRRP